MTDEDTLFIPAPNSILRVSGDSSLETNLFGTVNFLKTNGTWFVY